LWNKPGSQATVRAEITETTLQAVPGILNPGQDGYDNTGTDEPAPMGDLNNPPREGRCHTPPGPVTRGQIAFSASDLVTTRPRAPYSCRSPNISMRMDWSSPPTRTGSKPPARISSATRSPAASSSAA
jgi:hypothetical protein